MTNQLIVTDIVTKQYKGFEMHIATGTWSYFVTASFRSNTGVGVGAGEIMRKGAIPLYIWSKVNIILIHFFPHSKPLYNGIKRL